MQQVKVFHMSKTFYLGELFCGPGGMALGAKLAKPQKSKKGGIFSISHVWGVDKDSNAIDTYNANNLGEGIECDAIAFTENHKNSNSKTIEDFDRISALAFGFPCNDFSLVGTQKGFQGKFGNLYIAGISAINFSNPDWFIAENVSGIHSTNSGDAFIKILNELENAGVYGYNLTIHLFKFENYGVPQYRHRYIIVGIRKDKNIVFKVPAPTHIDNYVTVKDKLSEPYKSDIIYNNLKTKQHPRIEERLLFTPPWKNAWFLEELLSMKPKKRREALAEAPWYNVQLKSLTESEIVKRIEACRLHCTSAKMSHIYRRLHPDKPSYTITGSGGGGTHVYHWEECRALTNRERARIQTFPDEFIFKGTQEQVRKQIGMAVPPEGAKIIFEAILKTFAGVEYQSVESSYKTNASKKHKLYK
jgi:DNA (cytosine-5)-methyltransferase 1